MASVNVLAVRILNNPATFLDPFAFEIEYEALANLQDDLEWRVIYVGSAEGDNYDQVLESIFVGPVTAGSFRFTLETNPPEPANIPADDLLGVTVILLTCSYRGNEFIRVGYYVNVEYLEEELRENPPEQPLLDRLHRSILADHPRVTRFAVPFDEPLQDPGMMDVAMEGEGPAATHPDADMSMSAGPLQDAAAGGGYPERPADAIGYDQQQQQHQQQSYPHQQQQQQLQQQHQQPQPM